MSNADKYQAALNELIKVFDGENSMSLNKLWEQWQALGAYKMSASFKSYTAVLRDVEAGDFSQLDRYMRLMRMDADFCALLTAESLPTVDELEAYARGRQAEAAHDYEGALAHYQRCGAILDSILRVEHLMMISPAILQENVIVGEYRITTYENGTCEITSYTGIVTELNIHEKLGGYSVTAIGDYAFFRCPFLTNITIPESVISIGDGAFSECSSLISIIIPERVKSIGERAFSECDSLSNINIPDSVTTIHGNTFQNCDRLTNIIVSPSHPTLSIIDGVLFNRADHKLILYPHAFTASHYVIPQGTHSIGNESFWNCGSLTSITIPQSITAIGNDAFTHCSSLVNLTIPNSIVSIGDRAFACCNSLISVEIPDSVMSLGINPFQRCNQLTDIIVSKNHPIFLSIDGVLISQTEKKLICYPCTNPQKQYAIPQGILAIGNDAFIYCNALTSVTIPDGVLSIGDYAFYGCNSLTNITIPNSITSIGSASFSACPTLTLSVPINSHAHQYAIDNNIPYTTY